MRGGWVYIMTNRPNGTLYVGVTSDIGRRAYEHREGLVVGGGKYPRLDGASSGQSASAEGFARWSDSGSVFWESNLWGRHVPSGAARSSVCGDDAVVLAAIKDASRRLRRRPSGVLDRRCARRRV